VGISLIEDGTNTERRELLRLHLSKPALHLSRRREAAGVVEERLELTIRDAQIDNQLLDATYPVLLCSQESERQDFLSARMVRSNRFAKQLEFLKSFELAVAPIQLNLDADILKAAMQMATRASKKAKPLVVAMTPQTKPIRPSVPLKIYVEDLKIAPIRVRVNFRGVFSLLGASNWFGDAHVEGAVLHLRPFHISHSLLSAASDPIANRVLAHYMQSLRRQWYILLSSIDLFGDPIGLGKTIFQGLKTGANEAVATRNPVLGLARGTWTIVKAVVLGVTNSMVNISNGASAALSFAASSPHVSFPRPRNFLESLSHGVAGLVLHPFWSLKRRRTVRGFLYGLLKGLTGLLVHPLLAALGVFTRITSALRAAADSTSKVRTVRSRTPRFLRPDQRIRVYDPVRAKGEEALWAVGLGKLLHWRSHLEIASMLLVLTDTSLVMVGRDRFNPTRFTGIRFRVDKKDFVHARAAKVTEGFELQMFALRTQAVAFDTIRVPCAEALASEATEMVLSWARTSE
jgi:hypothetical protein